MSGVPSGPGGGRPYAGGYKSKGGTLGTRAKRRGAQIRITHRGCNVTFVYSGGKWKARESSMLMVGGKEAAAEGIRLLLSMLNRKWLRPRDLRWAARALSSNGVFSAAPEASWGALLLRGEEPGKYLTAWRGGYYNDLGRECIRRGSSSVLRQFLFAGVDPSAEALAEFALGGGVIRFDDEYPMLGKIPREARLRAARMIAESPSPPREAVKIARALIGCGVHDWDPVWEGLAAVSMRLDFARRGRRGDAYERGSYVNCLFHPRDAGNGESMMRAAASAPDHVKGEAMAAVAVRREYEANSIPVLHRGERGRWTAALPPGSATRIGLGPFTGLGWWEKVEAHPFGHGEIWEISVRESVRSTRGRWDPMSLFGKYSTVKI